MYNFGSPRVGNALFVQEYNSKVHDSWRVFNKNDIVSSVPRMGNYKHICNSVAVSAKGIEIMGACLGTSRRILTITCQHKGKGGGGRAECAIPPAVVDPFVISGDHAIKDVLGEGINVADVVPGLFEKGLDLTLNEELKALVDQELAILDSISSGR